MENSCSKGKIIMLMLGIMIGAACCYMKTNPEMIYDMKEKAKSLAKKTYDRINKNHKTPQEVTINVDMV